MVTRCGREVGGQRQQAAADAARSRAARSSAGVPEDFRIRTLAPRDPSRSTVNSKSTWPREARSSAGLRHDPVPVDLVLEVVDPGGEVRALGVEEERAHLLARAAGPRPTPAPIAGRGAARGRAATTRSTGAARGRRPAAPRPRPRAGVPDRRERQPDPRAAGLPSAGGRARPGAAARRSGPGFRAVPRRLGAASWSRSAARAELASGALRDGAARALMRSPRRRRRRGGAASGRGLGEADGRGARRIGGMSTEPGAARPASGTAAGSGRRDAPYAFAG